MIKDYMTAGGKAILTVNYSTVDLKNVQSLLDYYGLKVLSGFIVEQDSNMFIPSYPHYLIPSVESHDVTTQALKNKLPVVAPLASALVNADNVRGSLKIVPILTTSDKAYNKTDINTQTLDKVDGDTDGPFNIGVVSEDTYNDKTSDLVVYSTDMIFSEDVLTDYGNADILSGTVRYLSGDSASLPIASKSIVPQTIRPSQQQAMIWGTVTVIFIPIIILVTGIVVNYRRRKR
jgi:ABC-2 type transport system permease protein